MNDVSDKDIDFSTDSQQSEFNIDSDVDWPSMLGSSQPLPSYGTVIMRLSGTTSFAQADLSDVISLSNYGCI
jgi:hypothetical protein